MITGASSGLGEALALHYARSGTVARLTVHGRDERRLGSVIDRCTALGTPTAGFLAAVEDAAAMASEIGRAQVDVPLDLVIANAGIAGDGTVEQGRAVLAVNLLGVWNTIAPVLPSMRAARRGQLGLMSSLAGIRGLADAAPYCAAKAGARVLAESLRLDLAKDGIEVSAICPGFVDTPLTRQNPFSMPWLMPPEQAAARIALGLERNEAMIAFPWQLAALVRLIGILPNPLAERVLRWARPG